MKTWLIGIIFTLVIPWIDAKVDLDVKGTQAETFVSMKEYARAEAIYLELLDSEPSDWQRQVILYNLGTIDLLLGHIESAMEHFEKINLSKQTPPAFLRSLRLQQVIANLLKVDEDLAATKKFQLNEDEFLIDQALYYLEDAEKIDCYMNTEMMKSQGECKISADLSKLRDYCTILERRIKAALRKELSFQEISKDDPKEKIRNLFFTFQFIQTEDVVSKKGIEWIKEKLEALSEQYKHIKGFEEGEALLNHALESLQEGHLISMRFYLNASYSLFIQLFSYIDPQSPVENLSTQLQVLELNLKLRRLDELLDASTRKTRIEIVEQQFNTMIENVTAFPKQVIEVETKEYRQTNDPSLQCQKFPWERAIPLFEEGYILCNRVQVLPFQPLTNQKRISDAIVAWRKALELMLKTPESDEKQDSHQPSQIDETFRQIQEMFEEDKEKRVEQNKERHSW